MEWSQIALALIVALPPLLAQIITGLRDEQKAKVEGRRDALSEWKELYKSCSERVTELEDQIAEKDQIIADLREQKTRPRVRGVKKE